MATLVSPMPPLLLHADLPPPSTGILLNPRRPSSQNSQQAPMASSSSSVSQSEDSHSRSRSSTFGEASARKIRFAPLPNPRRALNSSVFDPDESESEPPLPHHDSAPADIAAASHPSLAPSFHSIPDADQHSDDQISRPKATKVKSRIWGQKLFRPLLHPLHPRSPSSGHKPTDEARISPQYNAKFSAETSVEYKGGAPLGRPASTNSIAFSKETERTQSLRDVTPFFQVFSDSAGGSVRARKDGHRMLNGHVYGKRLSSVPKDHDQPWSEPEFVEWGFGGMGSVRASSAGLDWAKVQSRGRTFVDQEDDDGEGNDGSGMGWVKRRREQRERERQEKEQQERAQVDNSIPDIEVHPPESTTAEETSAKQGEPDADRRKAQHIYQAVSVPAPQHHLSRNHSYHKTGEASGTVSPASTVVLSRRSSVGTESAIGHKETLVAPVNNTLDLATSSEGSDEDDDDEANTERDSEDDDDVGHIESRITCKSAGVEKISRHKE